MTPFAVSLISAGSLCLLLASAAAAGPRPHLIWQDRQPAVPGLDSFKKIGASDWQAQPGTVSDRTVMSPHDRDVAAAKGRALLHGSEARVPHGWH